MEASLVYTFGEGKSYQMGDGTTSRRMAPRVMEILEGAEVVKDIVCYGNQTWELRGKFNYLFYFLK